MTTRPIIHRFELHPVSRRRLIPLAAIAICLAVDICVQPVSWGQSAMPQPAVQPNAYGIILGRDTTYLTGPLFPDGTVDYAEAVNAEASRGVTSENNAACSIERILMTGKSKFWNQPEDVLVRMGVDPKATRVEWVDSSEKINELITSRDVARQPWKRAEMPELAAWLQSNKAGMALFVEASGKHEWWIPARWMRTLLVFGDASVKEGTLARAMWLRGMLKLGEGDVNGSWEDLAACERMAGLMSKSPHLLGKLTAMSIHNRTMVALWRFIEHAELSPGMLRQMDALLATQRQWPPDGEVVRQSERYYFLAAVASYAKGMQVAWDKSESRLKKEFEAAGLKLPDWNRVMRLGNGVYDMMQADETRMSDQQREEHRRAIAARISELTTISEKSKPDWKADGTEDNIWLMPRVGEAQDAYSDRIGAALTMLTMPDLKGARHAFDSSNERTAWTRVAVAVLRYRQDRGGYPSDLKALVPVYVAALPEANAELPARYEKTATGFVLTNESTATTKKGSVWGVTIRRDK